MERENSYLPVLFLLLAFFVPNSDISLSPFPPSFLLFTYLDHPIKQLISSHSSIPSILFPSGVARRRKVGGHTLFSRISEKQKKKKKKGHSGVKAQVRVFCIGEDL